jgi:N-acetyl-anhydromuramyl-L-alanine amidase AmpD
VPVLDRSRIERAPTPNLTAGRQGRRPIATTIHVTEGSRASVLSHFASAASKVSSHYLVCRNGAILQFVDEDDTAWANGRVARPTWSGLVNGVNPNLYTISIEHEARTGMERWPAAMLDASAQLIADIHQRWRLPISGDTVVEHRRIFADKSCPGTWIEVDLLRRWASTYRELYASQPQAGPRPGERRWSNYFQSNVELALYQSDTAWTFYVLRSGDRREGPFPANAKWSEMPPAR